MSDVSSPNNGETGDMLGVDALEAAMEMLSPAELPRLIKDNLENRLGLSFGELPEGMSLKFAPKNSDFSAEYSDKFAKGVLDVKVGPDSQIAFSLKYAAGKNGSDDEYDKTKVIHHAGEITDEGLVRQELGEFGKELSRVHLSEYAEAELLERLYEAIDGSDHEISLKMLEH